MTDIDVARQLVAYVDATTNPTVHPEATTHAEIIMLDTRTDRHQGREESPRRWRTLRWPAVAAAVLITALIGSLFAIVQSGDDTATTDTAEFGLVGGEAAGDLSGLMGWGFADEPLTEISSPGPTLEVEVGEEVTVTFTNEHGWSQDPGDQFFESVDQSFRVITPGQIGDVKFGADTGLVAPGETVSISFTPDEVGEFRYVSTGFISNGMFGRFIVVESGNDDS